jgi:hypothetical protein
MSAGGVPMMRFNLALVVALAATLTLGPALAKSSGVSRATSSTHSTRSTTHTTTTKTKALPAGTRFVHKTCKTASCKAKHPSGSYMLPIKPKKTG